MENKNLKKGLYRLATPIFFELLFIMTLGIVDTLMLSKYSDNAVGAVSNANTIISFLIVLLNVVSVGIGVVISNHLGAGNKEFAKKAISTGVFFNLSLGLILLITFQFGGEFLFTIIDTDKAFLDYSVNYMKIVTFGIPLLAINGVLSASLRSHGKPLHIMVVTIISNLINVFVNYVLIYDKFNTGISLITGVNGAAIGTLISHIFNFTCSVILTKKLIGAKLFSLNIDFECFRQIIKIGLPSAFENVTYNVSQVLVMKVVNNLPNAVIAVNTRAYIMTLIGFIYQFSCAFANANQIIVGYDIGEGNYKKAYKDTYKAYFSAIPIVMLMVLILNIFARPFLDILTDNEEIIELGIKVLPMVFLLEFGRTFNLVFIQALKAAGDTIYPLIGGVICMLLIASGGSYIFGLKLQMGLLGVFLAYGLDETIRGIFMVIRWNSKKWESKSLIKHPNIE